MLQQGPRMLSPMVTRSASPVRTMRQRWTCHLCGGRRFYFTFIPGWLVWMWWLPPLIFFRPFLFFMLPCPSCKGTGFED